MTTADEPVGAPPANRGWTGTRGLRVYFALAFVGILAPITALSFAATDRLIRAVRENTIGAARESLIERKAVLLATIQAAKRSAYEAAHNPDASRLVALAAGSRRGEEDALRASLRAYATRLIRELGFYAGIVYLDTVGSPVFQEGAAGFIALSAPRQAPYFRAAQLGNVTLSEPIYVAADGRAYLAAASPMFGPDSRFIGVAVLLLAESAFFEDAMKPRLDARFSYGVVDAEALVLAGRELGAGRSLHYASPSAAALAEEIRAGTPTERLIQTADGSLRLCVLESVGVMPWYLAALVPAEQLRRPIAAAYALLAGIVGVSATGLAFGIVRSAQIRKTNLELTAALDELRAAQEHALQAERSAVLGSALAGMAHELNTPIGVALTSASFMGEQLAELGAAAEPGLARLAQAASIVESSLKRSSAIVSSFKRVAASGRDERAAVVDLALAAEDALNLLSAPLRAADVHTVMRPGPPIYIRCSQNAISRVMASVAALASGWAAGPKLLQAGASMVDGKACLELYLSRLPSAAPVSGAAADAAPARADGRRTPANEPYGQLPGELAVLRILIEKDLGAQAEFEREGRMRLRIRIRMDSV